MIVVDFSMETKSQRILQTTQDTPYRQLGIYTLQVTKNLYRISQTGSLALSCIQDYSL